jgi:hypothetical protein
MVLFDGGFALVALAVWIYCIIDVITTPEGQCRNLPKLLWVFIVILLVDVGSIAWLVAGHNWGGRGADLPYKGNRGAGPAPTPGLRRTATNPDDDEVFLAGLRARAEEQRRRAQPAPAAEPTEPPTASDPDQPDKPAGA